MSEHYYPVSDYGPPTEDKCHHGYMWRRSSGAEWGDPRPPETAPDEMVLAHEVSGWGVCYGKTVRDSPTQFSGWYLLPKVGTDA